jgi:hypothetical protein
MISTKARAVSGRTPGCVINRNTSVRFNSSIRGSASAKRCTAQGNASRRALKHFVIRFYRLRIVISPGH